MLQCVVQPCPIFWPLATAVESTALCAVLWPGRSWAGMKVFKAHKVEAVWLVNVWIVVTKTLGRCSVSHSGSRHKTVVERSDVFHVWNFGCDNLFLFCFFLKKKYFLKKRVESKPLIQNVLGGGRSVFFYFLLTFSECRIKMIVSVWEPRSVHSFSSHWVIDWKEWVWFTCVKVRETVCKREAVTRKKESCKPYSCENERKCGLLLCSVNVFYIKIGFGMETGTSLLFVNEVPNPQQKWFMVCVPCL